METCLVDECGGEAKARGLCGRHYARDQRRKYGMCTIESCQNNATNRRGWCAKHYSRMRAHGTTDDPPPRRKMPLICTVDGCESLTRARGWCSTHWKRWRTNGTTDLIDPPDQRYCRSCKLWHPKQAWNINVSRCRDCARHVKRDRNIFRAYRVFKHEVDEAMAAQQSRCAICGIHRDEVKLGLVIDHDHATMRFRGLLCTNCNHGLGKFKDSPDTLIAAADYLRRSRGASG